MVISLSTISLSSPPSLPSTPSPSFCHVYTTHTHTSLHLLHILYSHIIQTDCTTTGILCNNQCPDELELSALTSDNWPLWSKIIVAIIVVGLAVVCMLIKMAFVAWIWWLERKQDAYLDSLEGRDVEETDAKLQVRQNSESIFYNRISNTCTYTNHCCGNAFQANELYQGYGGAASCCCVVDYRLN